MRQIARVILTASLAVILSAQIQADDAKKNEKKPKKAVSVTAKFLKGIDLTAEQKAKIAELDAALQSKLAELKEKKAGILNADQKKKLPEVIKTAKASSKDRKEFQKILASALGLTDEQIKQYTEVESAFAATYGGIRGQVSEILTAEQRAKLAGGPKKRPAPKLAARIVGKLDLNEKQKEQIAALDKEFGGKYQELQTKQAGILTNEQKKARSDAIKLAKKAKTKGKELRETIDSATQATAEQKAQLAETAKALGSLQKQLRAKVSEILTEEQRAQLGKKQKPVKKTDAKKATKNKDAKNKNKETPAVKATLNKDTKDK